MNSCSPNVDIDRTTERRVVKSAINENNAYPPRNFPAKYDGFETGLVRIISAVPCSYSSAVDPEPIRSATNWRKNECGNMAPMNHIHPDSAVRKLGKGRRFRTMNGNNSMRIVNIISNKTLFLANARFHSY